MRLDELNTLFKKGYPTGTVYTIPGKKSAFHVQYNENGRLYRFNSPSITKLAIRLELIPDKPINWAGCERIVDGKIVNYDEHGEIITHHDNNPLWTK